MVSIMKNGKEVDLFGQEIKEREKISPGQLLICFGIVSICKEQAWKTSGIKIGGIKKIRDLTGLSLSDAKWIYEEIENGRFYLVSFLKD